MGLGVHIGADAGFRIAQGLLAVDCLVNGALDGVRTRQITQANSVDLVAAELYRVRKLLVGAQADAARAEHEAAALRGEVAHAAVRADRAEHALARLIQAIQA